MSLQLRLSICTIALAKFGGEHGPGGGVEESEANGHAEETVEVDAGPDCDCCGEGENVEGSCDEAEGELSDEPGEGVVVLLVGGGVLAILGHEEGAYEATTIFVI